MNRKYLKPTSVTWWSGVALVLMGLTLGVHDGYGIGPFGDTLRAWVGDLGPSALMAQGAGLIGLRGALA